MIYLSISGHCTDEQKMDAGGRRLCGAPRAKWLDVVRASPGLAPGSRDHSTAARALGSVYGMVTARELMKQHAVCGGKILKVEAFKSG